MAMGTMILAVQFCIGIMNMGVFIKAQEKGRRAQAWCSIVVGVLLLSQANTSLNRLIEKSMETPPATAPGHPA